MGLRKFCRDAAGNVAMLYALGLAPATLAAGAAIEMNASYSYRVELQQAADAAVLAATNMPGATLAERKAYADKVFAANIGQGWSGNHGYSGALTEHNGGYRYTASGSVETTFMALAGIEAVDVGVVAEALVASGEPLEFVIAFDVTNSMVFSGGDWEAAKAAMQNFVTRVYQGAPKGQVVGTLLPFSDRVRLGGKAVPFTTGSQPSGWQGCIEVREQPQGKNLHRLTDDPPSKEKFEFYEPKTLTSDKPAAGMSYTTGCYGPEFTGPIDEGPEDLVSAIDDLYIGGTGRYDEGMAWAWRLLSPRWHGQWNTGNYPKNYKQVKKLAILVSDGRTEIYRYEVLPASGLANPYGWNMGSPEGLNNLEAVCEDMKSKGIEVHVVALPGNPDATAHFKRCASKDGFHNVTNIASFETAFNKIGVTASNLRLTR
jgi:hypothetical protein